MTAPARCPDLRAGVEWLLRRRLVALCEEERRLVPVLARCAVDLVKARAAYAAERGDTTGPPWTVGSAQDFTATVAPCLLAQRDRLRRVRALLDRLCDAGDPASAPCWLFWDARHGGLGPLAEMAVAADEAGLAGSAAWLDLVAPEGGVNRYLLREGGVHAAAGCVWPCPTRWQGQQARFAFELYGAACAAWQALLDWDLRARRVPDETGTGAGGAGRLEASVDERVAALDDTMAALRRDSRPALAAAGLGDGNGDGAPAPACPLVDYAQSLVGGVAELGRRAAAGDDPAVLARLASDLSAAMCVCIMGPPGTGKTRAARQAARLYFGLGLLLSPDYRELGRADLVGGYVGETEERTRKALEGCLEGFVLLDEAYALGGSGRKGKRWRTQATGDDYGPIALAVLVQFLSAPETAGRVAVWAAGYQDAMERDFLGANQGVPSRFPVKLAWPALTPAELAGIVVRTLGNSTGAGLAERVVRHFAARPRSSAREAEFLARRALRLARERGTERAVLDVFTV